MAGMLAFVFLPRLYSTQFSATEVVKLKQTVESGTIITDDMLTTIEVGSYGLSDNVIKNKSEIVGFVAKETVYAGEYLWRDRFTTQETYKRTASKPEHALSEGMYLLTISLPSESSGIAGILRSGDTVDIFSYMHDGGATNVKEALTSVSVYKVLNKKLKSLDELDYKLKSDTKADPAGYDFAPAYVVFTVNEQQAKVLIELEKEKSLHLMLRKAGA